MTGQAERIREAHRGWRQAEPASRSRLIALETFGLRFERVDDFNVLVEGQYLLNLALSYWRAEDNSCHGYLVSALDAEIKRTKVIEQPEPTTSELVQPIGKRSKRKPAPGRDSDATGDRTADSTTASTVAIAESGAGASSRLLPVVAP